MTRTQRRLLEYFLDHPGETISKETLMEEVWGRIVTGNSVDQVVSVLRGLLEPNPAKPTVVVNHYGLGFSFEADVRRDPDSSGQTAAPDGAWDWRFWAKVASAIALVLVVAVTYLPLPDEAAGPTQNLSAKQLLILPMTFGDGVVGKKRTTGRARFCARPSKAWHQKGK